jgi:hypothetical protein
VEGGNKGKVITQRKSFTVSVAWGTKERRNHNRKKKRIKREFFFPGTRHTRHSNLARSGHIFECFLQFKKIRPTFYERPDLATDFAFLIKANSFLFLTDQLDGKTTNKIIEKVDVILSDTLQTIIIIRRNKKQKTTTFSTAFGIRRVDCLRAWLSLFQRSCHSYSRFRPVCVRY